MKILYYGGRVHVVTQGMLCNRTKSKSLPWDKRDKILGYALDLPDLYITTISPKVYDYLIDTNHELLSHKSWIFTE